MAEPTLENYEQMMRRYKELTNELGRIGSSLQAVGQRLIDAPEWTLFTNIQGGYRADYGLSGAHFFDPEPLRLGPEKITEMVRELQQVLHDLNSIYSHLKQKYPSSLSSPPPQPANPRALR